ncbi:MAG: hypothetical protein ABSB33_06165 [Tepidisphaeraceae bacterium]|jgi:hypothetical protein
MYIAFRQSVVCRILIAGALAACMGCQYQSISATDLEMQQSRLNKTGLSALHVNSMLRITCAVPEQWESPLAQNNLIYSHQQWRSPDDEVGMGVAYVRTPVPLSAKTILWFAKARFSETHKGRGRLLGQWTDSLGRYWFEAESDQYHVSGYAMTRGRDAWVVYSGFRLGGKASEPEIAIAAKGADSVAPLPRDQ